MTTVEDAEPGEIVAFRTEVREWLEANASLRRQGKSDFKRRAAVTHQSAEEESAHVDTCKAWQRKIFEAGFAGITVPVEYGGRGGTPAQQRVFQEEAGRFEVDTSVFAVGLAMVVPTLLVHGSEEQKRLHIPALLRGDQIWCQLFSEPGAGSDLAGLTTRAVRDGDVWVVDGQKVWTSSAHVSDWGILLARTDWDVPKHRGITYFLVDMASPGVEVRPLRQITGVAHFNESFLTDVHIPDENVVGGLNAGWGVTLTTLMAERILISDGVGLGFGDFVELARHYGRTEDPEIRQRLARAYTRFSILRWLGERARAAMRAGKPMGPEGSVAKLAVSQHVADNGNLALAIEGAAGMLYEDDAFEYGFWQQQFLGQWGVRIGGGTEQIQRNILGERVLGLPPEARPDKSEPFREILKNA